MKSSLIAIAVLLICFATSLIAIHTPPHIIRWFGMRMVYGFESLFRCVQRFVEYQLVDRTFPQYKLDPEVEPVPEPKPEPRYNLRPRRTLHK